MNINFNLRDTKAPRQTSIILICRWDGKIVKFSTGNFIKPKEWSTKNQKVYSGVLGSFELNNHLDRLKQAVMDFSYKTKSEGKLISVNAVKKFLENYQRNGSDKKKDLLDCYLIYLSQVEKKAKNTHKKAKSEFKILKLFAIEKKIDLIFENIDTDFISTYVEYFVEKGQINETIRDGHLKSLRIFLNWSVKNDYLTNTEYKRYKFPYPVNKADKVALTEKELDILFHLDLSDNLRLEKIRDIFCVECYTSLRYNELENLKPENISEGKLRLLTRKTNQSLLIPLLENSKKLLDKYFGKGLDFPSLTNQKYNSYLKELCKIANFDEIFLVNKLSGNNHIIERKKKWENITTHTARRTFVTLSIKKGMKPLEVMTITGHKSLATFIKYYNVDEITIEESFYKAWENIESNTIQIARKLLKNKIDTKIIAESTGLSMAEIKHLQIE